jgi:hypothetical protein
MRLSHTMPLLTWREANVQLIRNLRGATRYMIPNLLDNHKVLRNNAFMAGSFVLVCSRITIANLTALKARGTPESAYRYQEAIRTTLRESGGWLLSFAVLRQIQKTVELGMRKAYGIQVNTHSEPPSYLSEVSKNLRAFINRQPLSAPIRWVESAEPDSVTVGNTRAGRATVNFLRKIPFLARKEGDDLLRGLYKWTPIGIGSLFSIIASGFVLEAITRDKSEQVINAVSRAFRKDDSPVSSGKNTFSGQTSPFRMTQSGATPNTFPSQYSYPFELFQNHQAQQSKRPFRQ